MNIVELFKKLTCRQHDFIKVGQSEFHTINYGSSELNKHRHVHIKCNNCCKQISYIEHYSEDLFMEG